MTNLIVSLVISFSTNWTGVVTQNQELGYVVKEDRYATEYEGEKKQFVLKTELTDRAIWRPVPNGIALTNFCTTNILLEQWRDYVTTNYLLIQNATIPCNK